jgi:hypothetical protein
VIYFDSAYIAKCYLNEPGAERVRDVAYGADGLASCEMARLEFAAILTRHGDILDVTGIVRSSPNSSGLVRSKQYGKARVFVGAGSQTTSDPAKPSMPLLRVASFEVVGPGCRS